MSMKLTALAMDVKVGNPLRKLVLLKLCDNANDQGQCWPSMQHIADQCEISRRSVATHINALVDAGFLAVVNRGREGKKSSNLYVINLSPKPPESPVSSAADAHPCAGDAHLSSAGAAHACAGAAHLSSAGAAHRTSHSLEPVNEPKKNSIKKSDLDFAGWPAIPSPGVWADYKKLRQAKKAPVSATVLAAMAGELQKLVGHGVSVDQALQVCCERGWQGLKCDWVLNHLGLGKPAAGAGGFMSARERDAQRFAEVLDYQRATNF